MSIEEFLTSLFTAFRNPNSNPDSAERLTALYVEHLGEFDEAVLAVALSHILRHRRDPFLPTIAECVEVCEHAKSGKLRDLLDPEGAKKRDAGLREIRAIAGPPITQKREPLEEDWVGEYLRSKGKATS